MKRDVKEIFRTKKIWMAAEVGFAVYDGHLLLASFIGSLGAVGIGHSGTTVLVPIPYEPYDMAHMIWDFTISFI